jgi:hypothetical protein
VKQGNPQSGLVVFKSRIEPMSFQNIFNDIAPEPFRNDVDDDDDCYNLLFSPQHNINITDMIAQ